MNFNPMLRVAALSLSFVGAAHAASGGRSPSTLVFDANEAAAPSAEIAPEKAPSAQMQFKGELVRASWYGGGERLAAHTSTGEVFRPMGRTAAHRTLPFGTMLKVTAASTGRSTIVRINDRGPAAGTGRSLDLSRGAAIALGIMGSGQARVYIEVMR